MALDEAGILAKAIPREGRQQRPIFWPQQDNSPLFLNEDLGSAAQHPLRREREKEGGREKREERQP